MGPKHVMTVHERKGPHSQRTPLYNDRQAKHRHSVRYYCNCISLISQITDIHLFYFIHLFTPVSAAHLTGEITRGWIKFRYERLQWFALLTKYYSGDKIRKHDVGDVYGTNGRILEDMLGKVKKIDAFVTLSVNGRKISLWTTSCFLYSKKRV